MFEWYYVGQYGQLGPLSEEQMLELVASGVIGPDTYVWKPGMTDWAKAASVPPLNGALVPYPAGPPPFPGRAPAPPQPGSVSPYSMHAYQSSTSLAYGGLTSPYSRVIAGILQIFLPGAGRIYLGYTAVGVLQFLFAICSAGILWLWSLIDAVVILSGVVKFDGYGRILKE